MTLKWVLCHIDFVKCVLKSGIGCDRVWIGGREFKKGSQRCDRTSISRSFLLLAILTRSKFLNATDFSRTARKYINIKMYQPF